MQVALWSGLTQQQSGILYRSGRPLAPPLLDGIPARVPASIAVAESHPYIVHSLGFAVTRPPLESPLPDGWSDAADPAGFHAAAIAAIAGDARLAFVHVLRVDTAGHRSGGASLAYRDAAASADQLLGELLAAGDAADAARGAATRWLVLADHGHLDAGGHGGEEPALRAVRACITGAGISPGRGGPLALVDISRALADSLSVRLPDSARGRALAAALAAPIAGDTLLPRPGTGRWAAALLILAAALAVTVWAARRRLGLWPLWWPIAVLSLVAMRGVPTLSTTMIYRPLGHDLMQPTLGALALLAIAGGWQLLHRREAPWRFVVGALAVPLAATVAALILCGGLPLLGEAAPIMPHWTAWSSPLLTIGATGALVTGLAVLASAMRG